MRFGAGATGLGTNGEWVKYYNIIMYDNIMSVAAPIGSQIRGLRMAKGWTLQELADRAGTSAPTIHRYEGGWDRFEIGTLRKIAVALDARLHVQLVPAESQELATRPPADKLVTLLSPVFWDRPLLASDLEEYSGWVLRRVLMFGNRAQVAGARAYFGDEAILGAVRHRGVDARTRGYWEFILGGDGGGRLNAAARGGGSGAPESP